jgi:endogenous inhibitor of DNA gyrase (YacG/DUF329 family)
MSEEHRCPICNTPAALDRGTNLYAPFCSNRCKLIDLGRWLGEGYRIPVTDETPDGEAGGDDAGRGPVPPRREEG